MIGYGICWSLVCMYEYTVNIYMHHGMHDMFMKIRLALFGIGNEHLQCV